MVLGLESWDTFVYRVEKSKTKVFKTFTIAPNVLPKVTKIICEAQVETLWIKAKIDMRHSKQMKITLHLQTYF